MKRAAIGLFLAATMVSCRGAGEELPPIPEFSFQRPMEGLLEAARAGDMPVGPLVPSKTETEMRVGDAVTALVTHLDRKLTRQWIVLLKASELSEEDRKRPTGEDLRIFTSTGREHVFSNRRAAIAIHIVGPYRERIGRSNEHPEKSSQDRWSGLLVNADYLSLGFDRACAGWLRVKRAVDASGLQLRFGLSGSSNPFPPEETAENRRVAEQLGVTVEDERAFIGGLPALLQFLEIASRTPGLDDILFTVLDVPYWSILAHGGRFPAIGFDFLPTYAEIDPVPWGLPKGTVPYEFAVLMRLNKRPALVCRMAVTRPRPPLLTSAGIIGIAARRPDGKGPTLMIQLVGARSAPAPSEPANPEATASALEEHS